MRPLLVGEVNPKDANPWLALYPIPSTGSGGRLAKILRLPVIRYLSTFNRVNLCTGEWDDVRANEVACALHAALTDSEGVVVLLGARVREAFGLERRKFFQRYRMSGYTAVLLPHPSGLSREWNVVQAASRARTVLRMAGVKL